MSFISFKKTNSGKTQKKLPPQSAWGYYSKRQPVKSSEGSTKNVGKPIVTVSDLALAYEGKRIISNLSFELCQGDYLCIVGENGSGKSTLISALLGLKSISEGSIKFHSVSKNEIGFLPQRSEIQNGFPALVNEVILTGCLGRGAQGPFISDQARKTAFANMEKLGITSLASRRYGELSGGQQQRVLLARALCAAKKLLVLDEPVTGLDPKATADIYSLICDLNKTNGMTVITVTHDVRHALCHANKILQIRRDSVFFGDVEEYKELPETAQYLTEERADNTNDVPFGDGGFRYDGGKI